MQCEMVLVLARWAWLLLVLLVLLVLQGNQYLFMSSLDTMTRWICAVPS